MENLNAEQVISELRKNDSCYAEDIKAIQNAIALITEQEQRIGELTAENEEHLDTIASLEIYLENSKTNTVRKMQDMVYEFADDLNTIDAYIIKEMIDQIAKEMENED